MQITLYLKEQDLPLFEECRNYGNLVVVCKYRSEYRGNLAEAVHEIGTVCHVTEFTRLSADGGVTVTMEGMARCRLVEVTREPPLALGHVEVAREFVEKSVVTDALVASLSALLKIALSYGRPLPKDVMKMIDYIDTPTRLADLVALYCDLSLDELQDMLETLDPVERLKKVYLHLTEAVQRLQVKGEIQHEVSQRLGKTQKEYLLREQMKQIQEELGEEDPKNSELHELRKKLESAVHACRCPHDCRRELQRLERMNPASPEHNIIRTYLDYLAGMPWQTSTHDNKDINEAERDPRRGPLQPEEGQGTDTRIPGGPLLKEKMKGPILCFVGPPGVGQDQSSASPSPGPWGESSSACRWGACVTRPRSAATAAPTSAPCRGGSSRRSSAAVPTTRSSCWTRSTKWVRIFAATRPARCSRCWTRSRTSPSPDHYLDVPFDLSKVMFITTANQLDPIPGPLKDRMEVLRLSGYSTEEKGAHRRPLPYPQREIDENGLAEHPLEFSWQRRSQKIICDYTREAGVRNLQRSIASICRKVAKEITQKKPVRHGDHRGGCRGVTRRPEIHQRGGGRGRPGRGRHRAGLDRKRRRHHLR